MVRMAWVAKGWTIFESFSLFVASRKGQQAFNFEKLSDEKF